jgi:hypothetical protein
LSQSGGVVDLPDVPTITDFGCSEGIFFFTVEGPPGAAYSLDSSTDLKEWELLGEGTTTGGPFPPSGFVFFDEVGDRFFLRVR